MTFIAAASGCDQTPAFGSSRSSFGAVLRRALSKEDWALLDPAIWARFAPALGAGSPLRFSGTMHRVHCSPIGALVAALLQRAAILPTRCGRNVPFTFQIELEDGELRKERTYHWDAADRFTFRSVFREQPALHEEFRGGLGMYLGLAVEKGSLIFRDRGYFLRLGDWRMPLPRWLAVGRFVLVHRNVDDSRFQVSIRIDHPLLGTLFYQRGEFSSCVVQGPAE